MAIQPIAPSGYTARRVEVAKQIGPNAMLVVFSAKPKFGDSAADIERFMEK